MLREVNVRGDSLCLRLEATVLGNLDPIMYTNYFANRPFCISVRSPTEEILRFYVRCLVNNGVSEECGYLHGGIAARRINETAR